MTAKGWTREPLVHFLIAGLLVFAWFALRGDAPDPASRTIAVSADDQSGLVQNFAASWQRPPTRAELDGLIEDYVRDEIYYREALRLGLDRDDAVVRRRMRSKMDYLAGAEAESAKPSDAVLQRWLDEHPAQFAPDLRLSFEQVPFAPGDTAAATAVRKALSGGANPGGMGVTLDLPRRATDAARSDIAARFGEDFVRGLDAAPLGQWSGPVTSGFGVHLVRVTARVAGSAPKLTAVRSEVENDWRNATLAGRREAAFAVLRKAYTVRIAR